MAVELMWSFEFEVEQTEDEKYNKHPQRDFMLFIKCATSQSCYSYRQDLLCNICSKKSASISQQCDFSSTPTGSGFCIASGDSGQNTVCLYMVRAAVAIWRPGPHYLPSTINTQEYVLVTLLQEKKNDKSQ